jgi:hypothetical protein
MRKRATNRMLLSDYMIAPIQRIMRYCLLLKGIPIIYITAFIIYTNTPPFIRFKEAFKPVLSRLYLFRQSNCL